MSDETAAKADSAVLQHSGGEFEMAVHTPTEGSQAVDVSKLLGKTGLVTYDPGFTSTAACSCDSTPSSTACTTSGRSRSAAEVRSRDPARSGEVRVASANHPATDRLPPSSVATRPPVVAAS